MVGLILTAYGDEGEEAERAWRTLLDSQDGHTLYHVLIHGTNLTDAARERIGRLPVAFQEGRPNCSLTEALNEGIRFWLSDPQVPLKQPATRWVGWIHTDMTFPSPWITPLLDRLAEDETIGKISPCNLRDGGVGTMNAVEREGNECPWIIPREIFEAGVMFDENFVDCGGREDWALNREIMKLGKRCVISPVGWIMHQAMQTRWKYQTSNPSACAHNATYYFKKYGTYDAPV